MKFASLLALCLGFFMVIMDATIVNVALPSIGQGLHADISWLQWIIDGYTLSFACLLLLAGHMSDQFGAKKIFQYSVASFIITSFLCGIASSAESLTICRLLQGASAAFIVPSSLALVNTAYTDNKMRSKAIGIWGAIGGIAAASGPIAGAILTSALSWRAVFMVNVPIGIICLALTSKYVVSATARDSIKFDMMGQCSAILAIAALAFALIKAGQLGWTSSTVIVYFSIFIISLITFMITEHHVKTPMFPLKFFKSRNFSIAMLVGILMNVGFYGELFILPLYFQHIQGYSVLMTGFILFPLMAAIGISSYVSGKLVSIVGPKWPIVLGLCTGAVGFLYLIFITKQSFSSQWFILPFILMGTGIAFTMPAATVAIMRAVADSNSGIASGAFNTSRQLGSLIGVAIFGTIMATSSHFIHGMHTTLVIAAATFIIAAFFTILFCENHK